MTTTGTPPLIIWDEFESLVSLITDSADRACARHFITTARATITQLTAEREAAIGEARTVAAVTEALKPFAKYLKPHHDTLSDETVAFGLHDLEITVGELRRAAAALANLPAQATAILAKLKSADVAVQGLTDLLVESGAREQAWIAEREALRAQITEITEALQNGVHRPDEQTSIADCVDNLQRHHDVWRERAETAEAAQLPAGCVAVCSLCGLSADLAPASPCKDARVVVGRKPCPIVRAQPEREG